MELEAITTDLVEQTLRCWQQQKEPPSQWLEMDYLITLSTSRVERLEQLRELTARYVSERLNYYRQRSGAPHLGKIPSSLAMLIEMVEADFALENSHLEAWSALYYRYIEDDFSPDVNILTRNAHIHDKLFRHRVEAGLMELTRMLRHLEMKVHQTFHSAHVRSLLEQPDRRLYGSEVPRSEARRLLLDADGPRFLSIEGIGGIGKTAMARNLVEQLIKDAAFRDIIWISARQEWFNERGQLVTDPDPIHSLEDIVTRLVRRLGYDVLDPLPVDEKLNKLAPILAATPYLIVIDNLETVEDSKILIPKLYPLSGASRFLLTSRYTLRYFDYITIIRVPELSADDSRILINAELLRVDQKRRLMAEDTTEIYNVVGGIPLALKLAAAQLSRLPISELLRGLREAKRDAPETMFRYIYRQTWRLLSEPSQRLLLAFYDISPEGANLSWIHAMAISSGLTEAQFEAGLAELHDFSLLEVNYSFREPRYRLHRLTITFLQTDILRGDWTSNDN